MDGELVCLTFKLLLAFVSRYSTSAQLHDTAASELYSHELTHDLGLIPKLLRHGYRDFFHKSLDDDELLCEFSS